MYRYMGPRRKLSDEEKAANVRRREERAAKTFHCQCCGRAILANLGTIAHHGYERPGTGWQTRSCMGAKELPFEVSRERLGDMILAIKGHIVTSDKYLARLRREDCAVPFRYTERTITGRVDKSVRVTRAWFCKYDDPQHGPFLNRVDHYVDYDLLKRREIDRVESELRNLRTMLSEQQARYNGWKQTHRRVAGRVGERLEKIDA